MKTHTRRDARWERRTDGRTDDRRWWLHRSLGSRASHYWPAAMVCTRQTREHNTSSPAERTAATAAAVGRSAAAGARRSARHPDLAAARRGGRPDSVRAARARSALGSGCFPAGRRRKERCSTTAHGAVTSGCRDRPPDPPPPLQTDRGTGRATPAAPDTPSSGSHHPKRVAHFTGHTGRDIRLIRLTQSELQPIPHHSSHAPRHSSAPCRSDLRDAPTSPHARRDRLAHLCERHSAERSQQMAPRAERSERVLPNASSHRTPR